jgi:hypothetical protein
MKTSCFLTFFASFWVEQPDQMPAWLQRHLQRCDACNLTFGAESRVAHRLSAAPLPEASPWPTRLEQRILARTRSESCSVAARPPALRWAVSVAAMGLCAALLALLMPRPGQEMAAGPDLEASGEALSMELSLPGAGATALPRVVGAELLRWSQSVHEPLEQEWARTVEDGHRLLAAVVESCIPDPAAEAFLNRTRQLLPTPSRVAQEQSVR